MMKKGCFFDLDGTLVNSLRDLAESSNKVLDKHGYKTHPIEDYNLMVGNGVRMLMKRALEDHDDMLDVCLDEFNYVYELNCLNNTYPYEGIKELLVCLKEKNILLGVVTNKPHHLAVKIVDALFPDTFDIILGNQSLYSVKPDPSSTRIALESLSLTSDDCIFIGDSNVDIQTAINSNMDSIGVCWGFRGEKELREAGADYICFNAYEIERIVLDDYCG